jgi:hypothetical protein
MKKWTLLLLLALPAPLLADQVTLISGEVLEGEILSEDARELVFETARTRSRTHRIVHHLAHNVVRSVSRQNPRPEIMPELAEGSFAGDGVAKAEPIYDMQALKDALAEKDLLDRGQYDEAIGKYKIIAERVYAATRVETNLSEKAQLLTLQQNSYDLWIVAIEGKVDALEEKEERLEEVVENELELAEDELEALRDRLEDRTRDTSRPTIRLGSGRTATAVATPAEKALVARHDAAKRKMMQFGAWKKANGDVIKAAEAEAALLEEKSKQIKGELTLINREIRDQERGR